MLCICKNIPQELINDGLKVGGTYRMIEDEESGTIFVYGFQISKKLFDDNFVSLHSILLKAYKKVGLIKDSGKVVSKKEFKEQVMFGGRDCAYFYTHPKELLFKFNAWHCSTKKETLDYIYATFLETVEGNLEAYDDEEFQIGNSGIPLGGGSICFRYSTILDLPL